LINNPGTSEDIINSGCIKNIQIFGDQIDINLSISNPSLQARKKIGS
jgi:ATP-binding protein involved in chromosome partitioning